MQVAADKKNEISCSTFIYLKNTNKTPKTAKWHPSFMLTGSQTFDWCDCSDAQVCQSFLPFFLPSFLALFLHIPLSFFANGLQPSVTLRGLLMTSSSSLSTAALKQSCIKAWVLSFSFNNFIHRYKTGQLSQTQSKNNDLCLKRLFSSCRTHYGALLSWGGEGIKSVPSTLSANDDRGS